MSDSILMKQRVNVTDEILEKWLSNLKKNSSSIISKFLIKPDHIGKLIEFKTEDEIRSFKIIGMTEGDHVILEEINDGSKLFWECTYQLVQYKLGLANHDLEDGEVVPYTDSQLYINTRSRKKRTVKDLEESLEDLTKEIDPNCLFEDEES